MKTSETYRKIFLHALAWAIFILYELSVVFLTSGPKQSLWWTYPGYYILHMLLFYANAHGVLACFARSRKLVFLLALLVPLELLLYILLQYGLEHLYNVFRPEPSPVFLDYKFIIGYTWRGFYFIGLSTAYWLVGRNLQHHRQILDLTRRQAKAEHERMELEKTLIQTQNAYLQAQINPHLLFNTLNFIYNKVQDVSQQASEGVLLLSEVMRHALAPLHEDGKTDLRSEIEHMEKYIALNRLRFSYPLYLDWEVNPDTDDSHRIPPLILLTFVENMFTHGDLTDPARPAAVALCCTGDQLHFRAENTKRRSRQQQSYGIGLRNAETRLKSFYGEGGYSLQVQESDTRYRIELKLTLA